MKLNKHIRYKLIIHTIIVENMKRNFNNKIWVTTSYSIILHNIKEPIYNY